MLYTLSEATNQTLAALAKPSRAGGRRRTGAKVRAHSLEAGTFEHRFWRPYERGETDKLLKAAKQLSHVIWESQRHHRDLLHRPCIHGLPDRLTRSTIAVFEILCELGRTCKGEIFPSYEWLAGKARVGRATIDRALQQLQDAGFLVRQRRCKRIESDGPGPRYHQTSNAYRLRWPDKLTQWLGIKPIPAPVPQDFDYHRIEGRQELIAMEKQERFKATDCTTLFEMLSDEDKVIVDCDDPDLRERLASLALSLAQRESHSDAQPLHRDIILKGGYEEST